MVDQGLCFFALVTLWTAPYLLEASLWSLHMDPNILEPGSGAVNHFHPWNLAISLPRLFSCQAGESSPFLRAYVIRLGPPR